jgi:serine/threonine protein kinase
LHHCAEQLADGRLPTGWELVNSSAYARVAYSPQRQLYYKEFLPRSPAESLKALLRGSRATRARNNGNALLQAGIDAPANIAWGKLPGGREYLFMQAASGQGITQWLRVTLVERSAEQLMLRHQLLRALGTFIGRVHATGFIHGDLRPGNVLADLRRGLFRFTLIDNERNVKKNPPPGRMLLRNLMQLNMLLPTELSRADRMRFFSAWRRQMRDLSPIEAKILAAQSYLWAMRRMHDKGQL